MIHLGRSLLKFGAVAGLLLAFAGVMAEAEKQDQIVRYSGLSVKVVLFPLRAAVISSNVNSEVKQYNCLEGEKFSKGQFLVELDDSTHRQMFDKAQAASLEAKSSENYALKNFTRSKDLFKKGIQGHEELEKSELNYKISKSKMNFSDANLKLAEIDLKACKIQAPFAGRLIKKLVQEHEYVRVGQPLMNIIDDNQLLAVMHLPSSVKNELHLGQTMRILVDETNTIHTGKVYEISGEVDPGSRTFEIKALIDNRDGKLSAGMSGKLMKNPENNTKKPVKTKTAVKK